MAGNYPFKILMSADTLGGVWTYSLELIKALQPYHVEVALATMGAPLNNKQREDLADIPNVELYESNYKLEWMDKPWNDVDKAGEWLLWLNKRVQPDLIHLNNYCHGNLSWGKPVIMVAHSCVSSWWKAVKGEEVPDSWNTYKQRVTEGMRAADLLVAPTFAMLREIERIYGSTGDMKAIHNGMNPFNFSTTGKEPFIFSMGRVWDEAKNLELLAKAAPHLKWPVYIAGENKHASNGKYTELEGVKFLGSLSRKEVSKWLARASIYVLPARYEPFGLSLLEAAMSGCALVAGRTDSLLEIWKDAATYTDPDNSAELITIVNNMIDNDFYRKVLSSEAYNRSHMFSSQRMGKEYFNTYLELIMKEHSAFYRHRRVAHY